MTRGIYDPDPLRAKGTDDFLGLQVERPRSGMLIVWIAAAVCVVGLALAGIALFQAVGS